MVDCKVFFHFKQSKFLIQILIIRSNYLIQKKTNHKKADATYFLTVFSAGKPIVKFIMWKHRVNNLTIIANCQKWQTPNF